MVLGAAALAATVLPVRDAHTDAIGGWLANLSAGGNMAVCRAVPCSGHNLRSANRVVVLTAPRMASPLAEIHMRRRRPSGRLRLSHHSLELAKLVERAEWNQFEAHEMSLPKG